MTYDRKTFFDHVRPMFSGGMKQSQVDGLNTLLAAAERYNPPIEHLAYMLATAAHETAWTMQPIAEYGKGKGRKYGNPDPITGHVYYGRGYVQLTWKDNYKKASHKVGLDLVMMPDAAMKPAVAAKIMFEGMREGWFTGKKNKDYLDKKPPDYVGARRIINGTDRAKDIAGYALKFEHALRQSRMTEVSVAPLPPDVEPVIAVSLPTITQEETTMFGSIIAKIAGPIARTITAQAGAWLAATGWMSSSDAMTFAGIGIQAVMTVFIGFITSKKA